MVVYYFVYILQITLLSFYVMIQYYCIVHTGLKSEKNLNTNLKKYFKNMLGRWIQRNAGIFFFQKSLM